MLVSLSVRNIVLIDEIEFSFREGFCVLTGETGAGKSVLLNSLALATGRRADPALLRPGAEEAFAAAGFEVPADHPAAAFAAEAGIDPSEGILLRRSLARDGPSRAFVNEKPVTVRFLDDLGDRLVQIHGQHDRRGLLDPSCHGRFLDAFGSLEGDVRKVGELHERWRTKDEEHRATAARRARDRLAEEEQRALLARLDGVAPQTGEEEALSARRELLMRAGDAATALAETEATFAEGAGGGAPRDGIARARALLDDLPDTGGPLADLRETLGRILVEFDEASSLLDRARAEIEFDPKEVEKVEQRLFELRDIARRNQIRVDELVEFHDRVRETVNSFGQGDDVIGEMAREAAEAREEYEKAVRELSRAREKAGTFLDNRIADELEALRLQGATFVTTFERIPEQNWGPSGGERVRFRVATVSGAPPGPLDRIASGGELSRFLLAVHMALARVTNPATLVFDEIDAGVGGAVADAVGQRLARLARRHQVLAVTHQPQVAARGSSQWRIVRDGDLAGANELDMDARIEEIARMLSAADVTGEARAVARRLLDGTEG